MNACSVRSGRNLTYQREYVEKSLVSSRMLPDCSHPHIPGVCKICEIFSEIPISQAISSVREKERPCEMRSSEKKLRNFCTPLSHTTSRLVMLHEQLKVWLASSQIL